MPQWCRQEAQTSKGETKMGPKVGDRIEGHKIAKVEDIGHDTSMRYTLDDGKTLMGAHWDFAPLGIGHWQYKVQVYSSWGE